jgi:hypothetical protein
MSVCGLPRRSLGEEGSVANKKVPVFQYGFVAI